MHESASRPHQIRRYGGQLGRRVTVLCRARTRWSMWLRDLGIGYTSVGRGYLNPRACQRANERLPWRNRRENWPLLRDSQLELTQVLASVAEGQGDINENIDVRLYWRSALCGESALWSRADGLLCLRGYNRKAMPCPFAYMVPGIMLGC